jgi:hypothetical protein
MARPKGSTNKVLAAVSTRKGKYNAKGEHVDGHWFASGAEAKRYLQLVAMAEQEKISRLELQPSYQIMVKGKHIANYRADFRYAVLTDSGSIGSIVVEDVKGMVTDVYTMKKKLVEALYELEINEIPAGKVEHWADKLP